ncbi:putative cleavage and polyadenylation specificity factor subunit 4-like protein isoform X2 [Ambystoma mexicanum]|uniref:putative cleavage and polyadenylation specificity factor subunit 4-like protein isoform X2 n=1 Tax=Ambystoma mexicanum TaxID=8296 RepID=UPI0037E7E787
MQELIAGVEKFTFEIELDVDEQRGAFPLPFQGMDKSGAAVCSYFMRGLCRKGPMCPFRHLTGEKTVVCKHWLRGLCKKGDLCEFLHEYNMAKMPECYFYCKFGECSNKECPFLHIDPASKIKDCPWYDRGFCKHGPSCKHRHTRRVMCTNYLVGFCPDGPKCKFVHAKIDLMLCQSDHMKMNIHAQKSSSMSLFDTEALSRHQELLMQEFPRFSHLSGVSLAQHRVKNVQEGPSYPHPIGILRPLDQVTCFKCGEKGHYANKCSRNRCTFVLRK